MHGLKRKWDVSSGYQSISDLSPAAARLWVSRPAKPPLLSPTSTLKKEVRLGQRTSFTRADPTQDFENEGAFSTHSCSFSTICTKDGLSAGSSIQHIDIISRTIPGAESGHRGLSPLTILAIKARERGFRVSFSSRHSFSPTAKMKYRTQAN